MHRWGRTKRGHSGHCTLSRQDKCREESEAEVWGTLHCAWRGERDTKVTGGDMRCRGHYMVWRGCRGYHMVCGGEYGGHCTVLGGRA